MTNSHVSPGLCHIPSCSEKAEVLNIMQDNMCTECLTRHHSPTRHCGSNCVTSSMIPSASIAKVCSYLCWNFQKVRSLALAVTAVHVSLGLLGECFGSAGATLAMTSSNMEQCFQEYLWYRFPLASYSSIKRHKRCKYVSFLFLKLIIGISRI